MLGLHCGARAPHGGPSPVTEHKLYSAGSVAVVARARLGVPASPDGKESACNAEGRVRPLSQEDPLQEGMATYCSILTSRIPWAEEPGQLQSTGLQRTGHDRVNVQAPRQPPLLVFESTRLLAFPERLDLGCPGSTSSHGLQKLHPTVRYHAGASILRWGPSGAACCFEEKRVVRC